MISLRKTVRPTFQQLLFATILSIAPPVYAEDVCGALAGAVVIAQDDENTYLEKIANASDGKSIFNEYGDHGSKYSANSIWNPYSKFGSKYSAHSPLNKYSSTPPMLVKDQKSAGLS